VDCSNICYYVLEHMTGVIFETARNLQVILAEHLDIMYGFSENIQMLYQTAFHTRGVHTGLPAK
jgi:hypothetical protein